MPRNGYTLWKLCLACLTYCDVITKLCYHSPYLASPHFCIYLDQFIMCDVELCIVYTCYTVFFWSLAQNSSLDRLPISVFHEHLLAVFFYQAWPIFIPQKIVHHDWLCLWFSSASYDLFSFWRRGNYQAILVLLLRRASSVPERYRRSPSVNFVDTYSLAWSSRADRHSAD